MSLLQMRRQISYSAPFIWDRYEETEPGQYEYLDRIYSETADYPYIGDQDGYHYVMVKGSIRRYVWNVYNDAWSFGYKESRRSASQGVVRITLAKQSAPTLFSGSNYSFDDEKGLFTLSGRFPDVSGQDYTGYNMGRVFYQVKSDSTYTPQTVIYYSDYYPPFDDGDHWTIYPATIITRETDPEKLVHSRGSSAGFTAEDIVPDAYPSNGYDEATGFWYTFSRSYMYNFDNR